MRLFVGWERVFLDIDIPWLAKKFLDQVAEGSMV